MGYSMAQIDITLNKTITKQYGTKEIKIIQFVAKSGCKRSTRRKAKLKSPSKQWGVGATTSAR